MGYDQMMVQKKDFVVLVEGPFDLLKISPHFPVVCSMGKNISLDQIQLIRDIPNLKRLYLGLDPDAFAVFDNIAQVFEPEIEVYIYQPPSHRKDFGESSDREVLKSFNEAKRGLIRFPSGKDGKISSRNENIPCKSLLESIISLGL